MINLLQREESGRLGERESESERGEETWSFKLIKRERERNLLKGPHGNSDSNSDAELSQSFLSLSTC